MRQRPTRPLLLCLEHRRQRRHRHPGKAATAKLAEIMAIHPSGIQTRATARTSGTMSTMGRFSSRLLTVVALVLVGLVTAGCGLEQVVGDVVNGNAAERTATNVHDVLDAANSDVIAENIPAPVGDCADDEASLKWVMGKVAYRNLGPDALPRVNSLVESVLESCGGPPEGYSDWVAK